MRNSVNNPVRLAVFFDMDVETGGGYQQAVNAALLIKSLEKDLCKPIYVVIKQSSKEALSEYGIEAIYLPMPIHRKIALSLRSKIKSPLACKVLNSLFGLNSFDRFFVKHGIDIIYFTAPTRWSFVSEHLSFIFTVWDLCHRDEVDFPEVRSNRDFERRETLYRESLPKATAILVDSNTSRSNVERRYGVDIQRVYVMPFTEASTTKISESDYQSRYINIKEKYNLDMDYVYYPAQFWAHKNHVYLLHGLHILEERYDIKLSAIFSGSDKGNRNHIENVADLLGLREQIVFSGFVPNNEIPYLYRQSMALVMPTYFGPTNLPPLEAFYLNVPVIYSHIEGSREQVGNAALLLDLSDPGSLADNLYRLINEEGLRDKLVANGRNNLEQYTDEHRKKVLIEIFEQYRQRRTCWH